MRGKLLDHLGVVTHEGGSDVESDKISVSILRKLTEAEAKTLQEAIEDLYFFTSGEELYNCYQANMQDLLRSVIGFGQAYLDDRHMTDQILNDASFNFSRLTLNLLGMFKSFLDHGAAALTRRFGSNSDQLAAWEKAQSIEYDGVRSYRFFYNLRNYAQHVGMPPLHFFLDHSSDTEGVRIGLEFYRDELLSKYTRWSKDARADLMAGEEKIFLLPMLDEWSCSFHRLVRMIQSTRSEAVMESVQTILNARAEFELGQDGAVVLMPEPTLSDEGDLNLGLRYLPERKASEIADGKFLTALAGDS